MWKRIQKDEQETYLESVYIAFVKQGRWPESRCEWFRYVFKQAPGAKCFLNLILYTALALKQIPSWALLMHFFEESNRFSIRKFSAALQRNIEE